MNTNDERQNWVFLSAVSGIGPATLRTLRQWCTKHHCSVRELLDQPEKVAPIADRPKLLADVKQWRLVASPTTYAELLHREQITAIFPDDGAYSALLKESRFQPAPLYCKGNIDLLQSGLPIAVVGTRQATRYGERATQHLVGELVNDYGATIISGFMYGIDTIAHQHAVDCGGATIGVLGFGFGQMFPDSHRKLMTQYLESGALFISQFAFHQEAIPGNFPARNRVVAGLARAVVVTEAAAESGSLITASNANEEGRIVCAVPGPYDSLYSQGTRLLLQQGAALVTSAADIMDELGLRRRKDSVGKTRPNRSASASLSASQKCIYELVASGIRFTDELVKQSQLPLMEVVQGLSELELTGLLGRDNYGWFVI